MSVRGRGCTDSAYADGPLLTQAERLDNGVVYEVKYDGMPGGAGILSSGEEARDRRVAGGASPLRRPSLAVALRGAKPRPRCPRRAWGRSSRGRPARSHIR